MGMLIMGLVLFLGAHSTSIVAEGWRSAIIRQMGAGTWKAAYSLVSLVGLLIGIRPM